MLRPSPFEARIRSHLRVTDHRSRDPVLATHLCALVIARSVSDEAIQSGSAAWIASLHYVALAMTNCPRDAFIFPHPPSGERAAHRRAQRRRSTNGYGREGNRISFSRCVSAPELCHANSLNRHHRFDSVLHARLQHTNAGGSI